MANNEIMGNCIDCNSAIMSDDYFVVVDNKLNIYSCCEKKAVILNDIVYKAGK